MDDIKTRLQLVPKKPGCYQMKNADGEIIYVGKAKILQNRLKSYFTGSHDAKTTRLIQDIATFDYIITSSEIEALLLELNLIKEHRPKYNISLMDDKTYPYICVTNEEHPRIIITRDINSKLAKVGKLFGPYPNVKACRDTVEIINKVYPLRKCMTLPKKPCLYYALGQCLAPCINKVEKILYDEIKQKISNFLNGYDLELINELHLKMVNASSNLEFEKAIEYRSLIQSIEALQAEQKMSLNDGVNRDIFGYYVKDDLIAIQVFHMRFGKIIERSGEVFDLFDSPSEAMISYIFQFYQVNLKPQEILIPYLDNFEVLKDVLKIKVVTPIKGIKKKLVDLVLENAKDKIEHLQNLRLRKKERTIEATEELGKILNISYPKVIELFDNSNLQGMYAVSAMVTYIDGVAAPKDYRKYRIKTVTGPDDFHTMQEVIMRRYFRVLKDNLRKPNLILVDGGKPQVQAVIEVLAQLKLDLPVAGIVKDERHRTRGIINQEFKEISIDKKSNVFLLLEAMQNEVHRFALTFFKNVQSNSALASILDEIEGIGKVRKNKLLNHFDSLEEIKNASPEKLKSLGFPHKLVESLLKRLNDSDNLQN